MPGDERASQAAGLTVPRALASGDLEVLGALPNSSNAALLVRCVDGEDSAVAVYKPMRGEAPLWDFPDGTLHRREVAAFVLARALGWPRVPPTVLRDGPFGPGSVQLFVTFDPNEQRRVRRVRQRAEHLEVTGRERARDRQSRGL
jgi:uncharacterized repeat protein (TIGR03843 family)